MLMSLTTRDEIVKALADACSEAKRKPRVLGKVGPSAWDIAHEVLDLLLDDLAEVGVRQGLSVPPSADDSPSHVIR